MIKLFNCELLFLDCNDNSFILLLLSSVWDIVNWGELYCDVCVEKKNQGVLVYYQHGIRGTVRVKPLTWGHGPNFGSPGI